MPSLRHVTKLSPLLLALFSTTAMAATTVNTATTTPLKTSTAGDITVDNGGTITVSGQPAITVDSNNNVTTNVNGTTSLGAIVVSNSSNSGGILVNSGLTSNLTINGSISVLEAYTVPNYSGTTTASGPIANTTGRYGILVNGSGTGTITTAGSISVKGVGISSIDPGKAYGIGVLGAYTGNIINTGTISVVGDYGVGVQTAAVSGNLTIGGTITVAGAGTQGVIAGGDIGGTFTVQGTVTQASSYTADSGASQSISATNLDAGKAAVEVDGNVAGGILIFSPCSATTVNSVASCSSSNTTTTTAGSITSVGNNPGLQIGGATDITIAALAPSINGNKYSLVIDGGIAATASDADIAAVVIGGRGGKVSMPGGIGITGSVTAAGVTTATGILINAGSTVPSLINSGTVSATLTIVGKPGSATYAVRDLSGSLTSVTNNGTISATTGAINRAVDLSANTSGVTYTQSLNAFETQEQIQEQAATGYTLAGAKVYVSTVGDIVTGTGNDTINIASGTVTGNGIFGGGNDTLTLSNDAKWTGDLTFGPGTGTVTLSKTAQFTGAVNASDDPLTVTIGDTAQFLATAVTGGSKLDVNVNGGSFGAAAAQTIAVRNLNIGSGGTLTAYIDGTAGTSSLINAQTATFGTGSKVAASISSLTNAVGNFKILTAVTLSGNPTFDSSTTVLPVLFKGTVTEQANSLYLDITRKSATDLGLTSSEASAYDAIYANALVNSTLASSLLQVADGPTLQGQFDALLPDHAGATFDFVSRADRLVTRHLTDNSSIYDISGVGAWIEPVYFRGSKHATGTSAYTLDGYGLSAGLEKKVGDSRVGLSLAWISGKLHDGSTEGISATDYEVGAFWRLSKGPFYAFAKIGASRVSFNSNRTFTGEVDLAALTYTAAGHWAGWAVNGSIGASYQFDLTTNLNLKPMVVVDYVRLKENSYDETGSAPIVLNVDGRTSDSLAATTTVTAGWSMGEVTRDERPLTLQFEGGRRNQITGNVGSTTASFSGGDPFTITPDSLQGGWLGEARMLFGGMDYTWQFSTRAEQLAGKADVSARVSLSLAM